MNFTFVPPRARRPGDGLFRVPLVRRSSRRASHVAVAAASRPAHVARARRRCPAMRHASVGCHARAAQHGACPRPPPTACRRAAHRRPRPRKRGRPALINAHLTSSPRAVLPPIRACRRERPPVLTSSATTADVHGERIAAMLPEGAVAAGTATAAGASRSDGSDPAPGPCGEWAGEVANVSNGASSANAQGDAPAAGAAASAPSTSSEVPTVFHMFKMFAVGNEGSLPSKPKGDEQQLWAMVLLRLKRLWALAT